MRSRSSQSRMRRYFTSALTALITLGAWVGLATGGALTAQAQAPVKAKQANEAAAPSQKVVVASTASVTEREQKEQLAKAANKLIAEKKELWANEIKPSSTPDANDAEEQKAAAPAADDTAELAKKLSNPLASMISVPFQSNFDFKMGTGSGWKYTLNFQPVVPFALNPKWNLISRTIVPIIHQGNVTAPGASQSGLGDTVQSFWFSPNKSEPFIWGVGPAILLPTATNKFLGSQKLGLGPTVIVLKQQHGWTVGALANHLWSVAGKSNRANVNSTFIQPFLSYSTKDGWTYSINTESTYNWIGNNWSVPIHPTVAKLVRFGKQPVQFAGGLRCWVTSPSGGPQGCGMRMVVTALFPKK